MLLGIRKHFLAFMAFTYCSFVCDIYSELIRSRVLHLNYNSEQKKLFRSHATLILKIAGMHKGLGKTY